MASESVKKRILCVEDHQDLCEMIANLLGDYEVIAAYSKADALIKALGEPIDLYLIDYHLPDGTGVELCLLIRTIDQNTPIFFCTGNSSLTEAQILKAGAQRLIRKGPDFTEDLNQAVSTAFQ
ncbi:MAG TPA: response regulator [Blastocatellia bacterium]|nr:response regulator [Blastocatellia bacterium]